MDFPLAARFHLPEEHNLGRMLDDEMPTDECYDSDLSYGFLLAELHGIWLRIMVPAALPRTRVEITRLERWFTVRFDWPWSLELRIAAFRTMNDATADYCNWLRTDLGIVPMRERKGVPPWVRNVKLVLVMDMLRSNWEVSHDFEDVRLMSAELSRVGCPTDTLIYLPGWNGAYDSTYPTYEPHRDLGGPAAFERMIDGIHSSGFRAMIHTNAWGLDPYHPEVDELARFVKLRADGAYRGWQCNRPLMEESGRRMAFETDRVSAGFSQRSASVEFTTVSVPGACQAFLSIGGVDPGNDRIVVSTGRRSVRTPRDWFASHESCELQYPLYLEAGANTVAVCTESGSSIDWSGLWYRIDACFIARNRYQSWTHPILGVDSSNPEWIEIFVERVAAAVTRYGIDAVHVDATSYAKSPEVYERLCRRLPGVALAGEGYGSLKTLSSWSFSQGARQSLTGYVAQRNGTEEQKSIPDRTGTEELYRWLDKRSPVADFVCEYIKTYPHLCAADAFVPVGKVCNLYPPRKSPRDGAGLWRVLRDSSRLNYVPGLRLNYRRYGLDEQAAAAIAEIATRARTAASSR